MSQRHTTSVTIVGLRGFGRRDAITLRDGMVVAWRDLRSALTVLDKINLLRHRLL